MIALLLTISMAHADIPECRELSAQHSQSEATTVRTGTVQNTAWLWLRGYQIFISPADGATCTMFPSCSRYAMQAFQREGPLVGFWMTAARLMTHHDDSYYELCTVGKRLYRYDPPLEDTWWR
jgi:hypothetical protein